jgi:hypothetical protein
MNKDTLVYVDYWHANDSTFTEIKQINWREPKEPPMSTNILVTIAFILGFVAVMITRRK